MPKGYWIAHVEVKDPEAYKEYIAANAVAFAKFKAKFLVRGGRNETHGGPKRTRHVVIEFPSYEDAVACFHSPEYAAAKRIRDRHSDGETILVEGAE
jgi:uncharacterized protein (DUF1330 family)